MKYIILAICFALFLVGCITQTEESNTSSFSPNLSSNISTLNKTPNVSKPAITFVINTHDWYHLNNSAETLTRLLDIYDKYDVKAEFYFTEPAFKAYEQNYPEILEMLLSKNMTISFHIRAPHPVTFKSSYFLEMQNMTESELENILTDYETYELNLSDGSLNYDEKGGYSYIKERIGYAPIVAGLNAVTPELKNAELKVLKEMGLQMYVRKHSEDIIEMAAPGLLSRPSQFGIEEKTQKYYWFTEDGESGSVDPLKEVVNPHTIFSNVEGYGLVIVHENDFYAELPGWRRVYWKDGDGDQAIPKNPPYDITTLSGDITFFTEAETEQQWANYESIVAYAAQNFRVVTSRDIIADYYANN
ncbi:MAG: hypothetical protein ABH842_01285 [Candidatus Micrarchaeota archaeon]